MKRISLLVLLAVAFCLAICGPLAAKDGRVVFNVKDFGAVGDGKVLDTGAINNAIKACNENGGGKVVFPAGVYLSGTIKMLSKVTREICGGAVLKASGDMDDYALDGEIYPIDNPTRWAEAVRFGLIFARNVENISIIGSGVVDCNGDVFMDFTQQHSAGGYKPERTRQGKDYKNRIDRGVITPKKNAEGKRIRPGCMMVFLNSKDIDVRDVTIKNSPNTCLYFAGCENVSIIGAQMDHSLVVPNCDAINVCNSHNVYVSGCDISSGDDCIAIGATGDMYGDIYGGKTTENIIVTNCRMVSNSTAIRIGFGVLDVKDCVFENIVIRSSNRGLGVFVRAGQKIENILFSNIIIESQLRTGWWGNGEPMHISVIPGRGLDKIGSVRNVRFNNITADSESGAVVWGFKKGLIEDVSFKDVSISMKNSKWNDLYGGNFDLRSSDDLDYGIFKHDIAALFCQNVKDLKIDGFKVEWEDGLPGFMNHGIWMDGFEKILIDGFDGKGTNKKAAISLANGKDVTIRNSRAAKGTETFLAVENVTEQGLFVNNDLSRAKKTIAGKNEFSMHGNITAEKR